MSNSMLDGVSLAAVAGLFADLNAKLTGADGQEWLTGLKKFLRKENPWPEAKPAEPVPEPAPAVPMWRKVSDTAIEVDLDAPLRLPFDGAVVEWTLSGKTGWVLIERKGDKLFQDGVEITLHLDAGQKDGKSIRGDKLREKLKDVPGHMHPNVIDALMENVHLIPESWKKAGFIFAWCVGFRSQDGSLCVRCVDWSGEFWYVLYIWLDRAWHGYDQAAVSAS